MKIYAISGLGADARVFNYLDLIYPIEVLEWILPIHNDSVSSYANRLSKKIDSSQPFVLIGVSFGGIVAVEIAKVLSPEKVILISSAETYRELPKWYHLPQWVHIFQYLPHFCFVLPNRVAYWLFGTTHRALLKTILADTDPKFVRWAIGALVHWRNQEKVINCRQIKGARDRLIPPTFSENTTIIKGGHHLMIVDQAEKISSLINKIINEKTNKRSS